MPTGQPPIPEVTSGPFTQFISPPAPQQMQVEQAQSQGPQFNGYEGATGKIAGLLTKFIEGASVGRAQADAKKLQQQTVKQQQDAQQLNQYMQMVQNSDKDDDTKQQLQQKALAMQGKWVAKELEEGGKTNPMMKGLHMIVQTMMGGEHADVSSEVDPKTGKKRKVKTSYESGVNPEHMNDLWNEFAKAPKAEVVASQKSQALVEKSKNVVEQLRGSLHREPTQEEANAALLSNNLLTEGDAFGKKYGLSNPVAGFLDSFRKAPTPREELELEQTRELKQGNDMFKSMFGGGAEEQPAGQQPQAKTQPPPGSQFFVGGIQNGKAPEQAAPAAAAKPAENAQNEPPPSIDPQKLFMLSRNKSGKINEDGFYLLDTPGGTNGKYVNLYETPYGYYDKAGKLVPQDRVLDKAAASAKAVNKWQLKNIDGVVTRVNPESGEVKPMTWPDGRPMRQTGVNFDPLKRAFDAQSKFDDHIAKLQNEEAISKNALEKEASRKDPDGNPYLSQQQYAERNNSITKRFKELREQELSRFNNKQRFFQGQSEEKPVKIADMQGSNVVERNNNPLALKITKNGVGEFKKYTSPEDGVKDASDLLDKYMSPRGLYGVNQDSTLEDLMSKWAPVGDGDNDPNAYAEAIAKQLKLKDGADTKLSDLKSKKPEMMKFMAGWEGGKKFIPEIDKYFGTKSASTEQPPATPYKVMSVKELLGLEGK